jgi:hypothetical protein
MRNFQTMVINICIFLHFIVSRLYLSPRRKLSFRWASLSFRARKDTFVVKKRHFAVHNAFFRHHPIGTDTASKVIHPFSMKFNRNMQRPPLRLMMKVIEDRRFSRSCVTVFPVCVHRCACMEKTWPHAPKVLQGGGNV